MLIKVTYNKADGTINIENDVNGILTEVNTNAIEDTADTLAFEIAVDTTLYEEDMTNFPEEFTEEIEE